MVVVVVFSELGNTEGSYIELKARVTVLPEYSYVVIIE